MFSLHFRLNTGVNSIVFIKLVKTSAMAHFIVTLQVENKAGDDLVNVLMQPFLLYYVNHVVLVLTSMFISKICFRKGRRLYQNKLNLSLTFTQSLEH